MQTLEKKLERPGPHRTKKKRWHRVLTKRIEEGARLVFGSAKRKRATWYNIAIRKGRQYGFDVYNDRFAWRHQDFFRDALTLTKDVPGIPLPRCYVLQSCLRSLRAIDGDVAECGVREGRSAIFMLTADLRNRDYHLFDSFEGLSEPGREDNVGSNPHWKKGALSADEARVRQNLRTFPNVDFHVGWIPDTFNAVRKERFAFVHIDVDLYQPTKDALDFFYDRVVPGGMIVCDDYGSLNCPGARRAFDEFFENKTEQLIELPTAQVLVMKQHPEPGHSRS